MKSKNIFILIIIFAAIVLMVALMLTCRFEKIYSTDNGIQYIIDYIECRYNYVTADNISQTLNELNEYYSTSYINSDEYLDDKHIVVEYFKEFDFVSSVIETNIVSKSTKDDYFIYNVKTIVYYCARSDEAYSHYMEYEYTFVLNSEYKIDSIVRNSYSQTFVLPSETMGGKS